MFGFRWRWFKKQAQRAPASYAMKEIIWTTARCRSGLYYEWGLGYISEIIAQNVWDRYEKSHDAYLTTDKRLAAVKFMLRVEEIKQIRIMEEWKKELGA